MHNRVFDKPGAIEYTSITESVYMCDSWGFCVTGCCTSPQHNKTVGILRAVIIMCRDHGYYNFSDIRGRQTDLRTAFPPAACVGSAYINERARRVYSGSRRVTGRTQRTRTSRTRSKALPLSSDFSYNKYCHTFVPTTFSRLPSGVQESLKTSETK